MIRIFFIFLVLCFLSVTSYSATLDQTIETRYCGPPKRDANGVIIRSAAVYNAFRKQNACPSTGLFSGACLGYSVNHDRALACGGCDAVSNMSYMRNDVKKMHDSYERKIQGRGIPDTSACSSPPLGGIK